MSAPLTPDTVVHVRTQRGGRLGQQRALCGPAEQWVIMARHLRAVSEWKIRRVFHTNFHNAAKEIRALTAK